MWKRLDVNVQVDDCRRIGGARFRDTMAIGSPETQSRSFTMSALRQLLFMLFLSSSIVAIERPSLVPRRITSASQTSIDIWWRPDTQWRFPTVEGDIVFLWNATILEAVPVKNHIGTRWVQAIMWGGKSIWTALSCWILTSVSRFFNL